MTIDLQITLVSVFVGLVAITVYLWRLWKTTERTVSFLVRWFPALTEVEEFFALIEHSTERSHFFERHGPVLNEQDILERSKSGEICFSGVKGKPVSSSRWLTHKDLLRAIDSALDHWEKGARPKGGSFNFEFEYPIGEGYPKGGGALVRTRFARVIVKMEGVITAFPVLEPSKEFKSLASSMGQPTATGGNAH